MEYLEQIVSAQQQSGLPFLPLYRQEQEWKVISIALSWAPLANWVIRSAEDWLMPLAERMHELPLKQPVIHTDETPVQVLNENKLRLYKYQPERSSNNTAGHCSQMATLAMSNWTIRATLCARHMSAGIL